MCVIFVGVYDFFIFLFLFQVFFIILNGVFVDLLTEV